MLNTGLAADIERDLLRSKESSHNIVACISCGHGHLYKGRRGDLNGRFCSLRCQEWYDAGNKPIADYVVDTTTLSGWRVIAGPPGVEIGSDYYANVFKRPPLQMKRGAHGFKIACAHCRRDFDSKGPRCCSIECERACRDTQRNLADMAEVGIEAKPKRTCLQCGVRIPTWRNGRRVSAVTRFCSPKCSRSAKRKAA